RARAHRPRPARLAGPHPVADHAEAGAVAQAAGPRSGRRAPGDRRGGEGRAPRAGRSAQRGHRDPRHRPGGGAGRGAPAARVLRHRPGLRADTVAAGRDRAHPGTGPPRSRDQHRAPLAGQHRACRLRCRRRAVADARVRRRPWLQQGRGQRPGGHARARSAARRKPGAGVHAQRDLARDRGAAGGRRRASRGARMIRVLLAEDQAMVRGALSALLSLEEDIEVLGSAADGEAAWRELQRLRPDVLVTDIEMPGITGLDLAQRVQRHELPVRVVILTTFARPGFLRRALDAGVRGYLLEDAPAEQLAVAIRNVHRGGRAIDAELAVDAWGESDPLNDRERQVLRLAGDGLFAGDIATLLNLSAGTVRNYLSEAIGKLGAGNRIEALRPARQKGWL